MSISKIVKTWSVGDNFTANDQEALNKGKINELIDRVNPNTDDIATLSGNTKNVTGGTLDASAILKLDLSDGTTANDIDLSALSGGTGGAVDSVNGQTGTVTLSTGDIAEDTDKNYVLDADLTNLSNLSGTNTGDQDISGISANTENINTVSAQTDTNTTDIAALSASTTGNTVSISTNTTNISTNVTNIQANSDDLIVGGSLDSSAQLKLEQSDGTFIPNIDLSALSGDSSSTNITGATNGLTANTTTKNVELGGALIKDTNIDLDSNEIIFSDGDETLVDNDDGITLYVDELASGGTLTSKLNVSYDGITLQSSGATYDENIILDASGTTVDRLNINTIGSGTSVINLGLDANNQVVTGTTGGGSGAVDSVNGETGVVVLTTGDISEDTDKNYVSDAEKTVIGNTSGTNTGDQDISGISTNASDILTISADTAVNTGDISALSGDVATNTSDIATLSARTDTVTGATNGLTLVDKNVELGGALTGDTDVNLTGNTLTFSDGDTDLVDGDGFTMYVDDDDSGTTQLGKFNVNHDGITLQSSGSTYDENITLDSTGTTVNRLNITDLGTGATTVNIGLDSGGRVVENLINGYSGFDREKMYNGEKNMGIVEYCHTSSSGEVHFIDYDGTYTKLTSQTTFSDGTSLANKTYKLSPHSGVTTVDYWYDGKLVEQSTTKTLTLSTGDKGYIFLDSDGDLNVSTGQTAEYLIKYTTLVGYIYLNNALDALEYLGDERHGILQDPETHLQRHLDDGFFLKEGVEITGLADNSTTYTAISSGLGADEDIDMIFSSASTTPKMYMTGATPEWHISDDDNKLAIFRDSKVCYNKISTGELLEIDNDRVIMTLVSTNNKIYPLVWLVGQTLMATRSEARYKIDSEWYRMTTDGLASPEMVPVVTVIINDEAQGTLEKGANSEIYYRFIKHNTIMMF